MATITAKDFEVGTEILMVDKGVITQERMGLEGTNPVHHDPEFAKRAGFPGTLVAGAWSASWISELMMKSFGEGWVKGGKFTVTFIKPLIAGDAVKARGIVTGKEEEGEAVRVTLEVWCENQKGEKTTVGTASALVR